MSWGPLVFLNLEANDADKFKQDLEPLKTELDLTSFEKGLTHVKQVVYDMKCNWKVFVDNYLDGGYHVEHLHGNLSSKLHLDSYETEVNEQYSVQRVQGSNTDKRVGEEATYVYIFPNLMLNRYGPWLDTNIVLPTGPRTSRVIYDYFLEDRFFSEMEEEERNKFTKNSLEASDQVQQEDNFICEAVQKGLESKAYDVGRYAPQVEMADHMFHKVLAKQYRQHLNLD